jgi:hypothetical protein
MADQNLPDEAPPRKPLVLIKPAEMRRRRGISRSQEYVLLQKGLLPRPVWQYGSRYYVEAEIEEDTAGLIAARDAANGN